MCTPPTAATATTAATAVISPQWDQVCERFDDLPDYIKWTTGIHSICVADWDRMCNDSTIKEKVCPFGYPLNDLCNLYDGSTPGFPDTGKCYPGSESFDQCSQNWEKCLYNMTFNFCVSFPELCFQPAPQALFTDKDSLATYIC